MNKQQELERRLYLYHQAFQLLREEKERRSMNRKEAIQKELTIIGEIFELLCEMNLVLEKELTLLSST